MPDCPERKTCIMLLAHTHVPQSTVESGYRGLTKIPLTLRNSCLWLNYWAVVTRTACRAEASRGLVVRGGISSNFLEALIEGIQNSS